MGFTYKSYNFVDHDPMIDEIRSIVNKSNASYKWIHGESNVSVTTMTKWFDGSTRRPQAATMNAVLRSLGYKLGVVANGEPVIVPDHAPKTPPRHVVAPTVNTRHVVQMAKYKRGAR